MSKIQPSEIKTASKPPQSEPPRVQFTNYTSRPVAIPDTFLTALPPDSQPITANRIDFSKSTIPEYAGYYAIVLDHVLSPSECITLLKLAEESAGSDDPNAASSDHGWRPALVNAGPNKEVFAPEYRNSDRIVWDEPEIMARLWARCMLVKDVRQNLAQIGGSAYRTIMGTRAIREGPNWRCLGLNERGRFLRYGKDQFFREHCDGSYYDPKTGNRSFYTLHLYLNDSIQGISEKKGLSENNAGSSGHPDADGENGRLTQIVDGGATTFWSNNGSKRIDVNPKTGRVLIFQHNNLMHSGDDVKNGVKYTMRTDLMYEPLKD